MTRQAILEAAGQLLVRDGWDRASTNRIARRAGVSIGSLYQYFRNKEEVYLALLEDHRERVQPVKAEARRDLEKGLPAAEVFRRTLERSREIHTEDPELMAALETELAGLAAKHGLEGGSASEHWIDDLAATLTARPDLPGSHGRERAWLSTIILAAVSRRLVHSPPEGMDLEALIAMVVQACTRVVTLDLEA